MSVQCPLSKEAAEQCGCPVCVRSVVLCGQIEHMRISNMERGSLFDMVADWWALAHEGTEEAGSGAEKKAENGDVA